MNAVMNWRSWSIQRKLIATLVFCLALFALISSLLSNSMARDAVEKRITESELPAVVGSIRADIQRQIAGPLNAARTNAVNPFLLAWEAQGLPDDGIEKWKRLAQAQRQQQGDASVSWVSKKTGKYMSEDGYLREVTDKDVWLQVFLDSGKPYALNLDNDISSTAFKLFINARFDAGDGHVGSTSIGLSVDAMAKAIQQYKIGDTGGAFLARANGKVLIHRDAAMMDGKHDLLNLYGLNDAQVKPLLGEQPFAMLEAGKRLIVTS